MTTNDFKYKFANICNIYKVKVVFDDITQDIDNGYAIRNEIHLALKYSCLSIFKAVAFHELGHAIINMKCEKGIKLYKMHSNFNNEFNAWWLAQRLYIKYMKRPFNKTMGNFALDCLKTHSSTHYAFKDTFNDEKAYVKLHIMSSIKNHDRGKYSMNTIKYDINNV